MTRPPTRQRRGSVDPGAANMSLADDDFQDTPSCTPRPANTITGLDGKIYPRDMQNDGIRRRIVGLVHHLAHDEHLSVRQIQQRLAERGIRRSVGTIHNWVTAWECAACRGVQVTENATPEQLGVA